MSLTQSPEAGRSNSGNLTELPWVYSFKAFTG
ncbi:hypothetical protein WA016_01824 [Myxococcus stipitatus]